MKKLLLIVLVALLLLPCLAFAGGKTETGGAKKGAPTIRMISWLEEVRSKGIIRMFDKKCTELGAKFEYQFVDIKNYDNVINTQFVSGEGADIIYVGGQFLTLAEAGRLMDLTGQPFLSRIQDYAVENYRYKGKVLAAPTLTWFGGQFYNKDIFAKYNLKVPKTFDQYLTVLETLRKAGIKPITIGAKSWEPPLWQVVGSAVAGFYMTPAGKNFDKDFNEGKASLAVSWKPAVDVWYTMVEKGYLTEDMLGLDLEQAHDEFLQGKAAILGGNVGSWLLTVFREKNPAFKIGMFPYPAIGNGKPCVMGGAGTGFAINKDSKNKDICLKLVDLMCTEEGQKAQFEGQPGGATLKGLTLEVGPEVTDCNEALLAGNLYLPWSYWMNALPVITELGKQGQLVIAKKASVDDMLKAVDAAARDLRK